MCQLLNEEFAETGFRFTKEAVEFMKRWLYLKIPCKLIVESCSNLKALDSSSA